MLYYNDCKGVERLLWGLLLLKSYDTNENNASRVGGVDEGTFSQYAWMFIEAVASLKKHVIKWENRKNDDIGNDCLASVDGTDCQRTPPKACNVKGKKVPTRDTIRTSFQKALLGGKLLSPPAPLTLCVWNDLSIFCLGLMHKLENGERVEADDGYVDECPQCVKCPQGVTNNRARKKLRSRVRMRHETINERIKNFKCLDQRFVHRDEKHGWCFDAAAVLTQLAMEGGEEMFDCREYDDTLTGCSSASSLRCVGMSSILPPI